MEPISFPLSSGQSSIYYSHQYLANKTAFNVPIILKFNTKPNTTKLASAINQLVDRHAMLRAYINIDGNGNPNIIISSKYPDLKLINIGNNEDYQEFLEAKLGESFDLFKPMLIRFYLINLHTTHQYVLYAVHHHIIMDYAPPFLLSELKYLYQCEISNKEPKLTFPGCYNEFVEWELRYLLSNDAEQDRKYWKDKLINTKPIDISLLPSTKNPTKNSKNYCKISIPDYKMARIKAKARSLKLSPFAIMSAALFIILNKYTGQSNITIGTIVSNRFNQNFYHAIGDFSNIVMLHAEIDDQPLELIAQQAWKLIMTSIKHGRLPYQEVVDLLGSERHTPSNKLLQFFIVHHDLNSSLNSKFENFDSMDSKSDLELEECFEICQLPNHLLMIEIIESIKDTLLFFKYDEAFFSRTDIDQITKHYLTVLDSMIDNAGIKISEINFNSSEDENYLLNAANNATPLFSNNKCIHELFEEIALINPNSIAIRFGSESINYRSLNERSNQLARYLEHKHKERLNIDINNEAIIGIYLEKSIESIVAILTALKLGSTYFAIDILHPQERVLKMMRDAGCKILITNEALFLKSKTIFTDLSLTLLIDSEHCDIKKHKVDNLNKIIDSRTLAYIVYTSGTTGKPNGVAIEHRSVCNLALGQGRAFDITLGTKVLQFASVAFDACISEIWCTLLLGGELCLPFENNQLVGQALVNLLNFYKVEVVTLVPSILASVAEALPTTIKVLVVAGEAASKQLLDLCVSKVKKLINAYGPSEATVCATMNEYTLSDSATNIGSPIPNVQVYVFDLNKKLMPVGMWGEIYIGGAGIARGYYNNLDLTAKKFIQNPYSNTVDILYKTNDIGRFLPDGRIEFKGRLDNQVKIRGFRIEPEEIEAVISNQKEVKEVAVVVQKADEELRLIAFIVPKFTSLSIDKLRNDCSKLLPSYMMVNDYFLVNELPLTINGKVDKQKLIASLLSKDNITLSFPTDLVEKKFLMLCSEILKIDISKINLENSFFQLGGNSLTLLKFIAKIKKIFGIDIPIQTLFNANSLNLIVDIIKENSEMDIAPDERDLMSSDIKFQIKDEELNKTARSPLINSIFLTGVTGFLGSHLLESLINLTSAKIYCLIRATDPAEAKAKLERSLEKYFINSSVIDFSRIVIVCGDLSSPRLGLLEEKFTELAQKIDSIYHCGAEVNHVYTYDMLRNANVISTKELIKLACNNKIKSIHYISTIDTVTHANYYFDSETSPLNECKVNWGYIQSKWASEVILYNSFVPVYIYRPGNITGHSKTGVSPQAEKNHALLFLKSCIKSGVAPDWNEAIEMTPVDFLSSAIVKISLQEKDSNKEFYNLSNPNTLSWSEYLNILGDLGYFIKIIPFNIWKYKYLLPMTEDDPLFAFKSIYENIEVTQSKSQPEMIEQRRSKALLNTLGLNHVSEYRPLIELYMRHLERTGFVNREAFI